MPFTIRPKGRVRVSQVKKGTCAGDKSSIGKGPEAGETLHRLPPQKPAKLELRVRGKVASGES